MEGIRRQKHPGGTQEDPRKHPGGPQDTPRGTQKHPKATRRHPFCFSSYLHTLNRRLRMHAVQHDTQQGVTVQAGTRHQPK